MEKREAKIVENPKTAMFIKGHKTSSIVTEVLTDLVSLVHESLSLFAVEDAEDFAFSQYKLKKPDAAMMKKKNQILPFEDASSIEFLSQKNDA